MRSLVVDATGVDLTTGIVPFLAGYDVVAVNVTEAEQVLEGSDEDVPSSFTTLATIAANSAAEVTLPNYVQVQDSAGIVILLGN